MCCNNFQPFIGGTDSCYTNKTSAKENGRSFSFVLNKPETFCRIKIDGCVDNAQTNKKCDYLFIRCATKDFYFVELKGLKIKDAFEQIVSSIKLIQPKVQLNKENIFGIIASKAVPKQVGLGDLKKKFKRDFGKELIARDVIYI